MDRQFERFSGQVEVRTAASGGQAVGDVIIGQASDAGIDLVVMGAYGHSRIRNLIIGSTTSEMIRSCLVPVMLFR